MAGTITGQWEACLHKLAAHKLTHSFIPFRLQVAGEPHVCPGDCRGPSGPQSGVEVGPGRKSCPPLADFQSSAGDVGLAVAVKIADLDIDPGDSGAPGRP